MKKWGIVYFSLAIMLILILACPVQAGSADSLSEVQTIIKTHYVDPVPSDVLNAPTVKDMLKHLGDPYARYLTEDEYQEQLDSLDGNFTGVGIYISSNNEGVQVLSVIKGSPAEKAGLKKGDVIVAAGDISLIGLDSDKAMDTLRGPSGSTVVLKVKRGGELLTFNVTRENVEVPTVHPELLDSTTGYLGIDDFGQRTPAELKAAVKSLKKDKADRWIVDLRGNPGGYLETAFDVAGVIMGEYPVMLMEDREVIEGYFAHPSDVIMQGQLVVLQDGYSASAAEILAGALRDNQRAILLGKKTYGKGTVQEIFPLSNGDKLKITIARFYSPAGDQINEVGIMPDIDVDDENCLAAARLLLSDNRDVNRGEMISLDLERFTATVDCRMLRQDRYWEAWADIVDDIGESPVFYGNNSQWTELGREERQQQWSFYYPGYEYIGEISEENDIQVNLKSALNEKYINDFNIELINAQSGERIKSQLGLVDDNTFSCHPLKPLEKGEYWLVVHDTLRFADGQRLPQGKIAIIKVN